MAALIMTRSDFEALPDSDGWHRELLEGRLQALPAPFSGQNTIASNAFEALMPLIPAYDIFIEAGYLLSTSPAAWIQPDVSVLDARRSQATDPSAYFSASPDLAIDIVRRPNRPATSSANWTCC